MTLHKSERTQPKRNILTMWISFGPELSVMQRIGYALFSLCLLAVGLQFLISFYDSLRIGDLLEAWIDIILAVFLLTISIAGLVNVLRFPKLTP